MEFAAKKMADRKAKGKETVFKIRGRDKTSHEVSRYWGRRKDRPEDALPVPSTPPDVRYWTPSPAPLEASASLVSSPTHDSAGNGFAQGLFSQSFRRSSTMPPRLTSPGHLRDLELILLPSRAYYETCIQAANGRAAEHLAASDLKLRNFGKYGHEVRFNTQFGLEASARMALSQTLSIVPDILRDQNVGFIAILIELVQSYCHNGLLGCARELMESVVQQTVISCSATHPLILILRAMWQSFEIHCSLAEVLLRSGMDLLTMRIGSKHPYTDSAASAMVFVQMAVRDWYGGLKYSEKMYQSYKDRGVLSAKDAVSLANWHIRMVECHLQLGNYDEAARLIEELLGICGRYEEQGQDGQYLRHLYLWSLSALRYHTGLPGAVEAAEEALAIARREFGDDSINTMDVAYFLKSL